ncbi:MAG: phosphatidylglycerophosphatase A [Gammaproteobacteria bacterium]|jgi:phosphatidylglycerophosphatase A
MGTVVVTPAQLFRSPVLFLAFGFGAGLSRRAPGTLGTLVAIPLYLGLGRLSAPLYLGLVVVVSLAGVWICRRASDRLGVHDHPGIVWDELAGFLVTMIPAPMSWTWTAAGFGLFRLFDIWKPWPISWADRHLKGGLGIMVDDLLAGGFAAVVLYLIIGMSG